MASDGPAIPTLSECHSVYQPFSLSPLSPTFYFYLRVHALKQSSALWKGCKVELLSDRATADPLTHRFARILSHFMT